MFPCSCKEYTNIRHKSRTEADKTKAFVITTLKLELWQNFTRVMETFQMEKMPSTQTRDVFIYAKNDTTGGHVIKISSASDWYSHAQFIIGSNCMLIC